LNFRRLRGFKEVEEVALRGGGSIKRGEIHLLCRFF
jgi:hypothetical protein